MNIILIMAQSPTLPENIELAFIYFLFFFFSVFSPSFSLLAGTLILNNTVMMSKQHKLYPAAIWNGEHKSFIYTVFFKKRMAHGFPPLQRWCSRKKWFLFIA